MSNPAPIKAPWGKKCARLFTAIIRAALTPLPTEKIWQWIDRNVRVPVIVGSRFPGALDTGHMPQWRGLLEKYSDRRVHFFTLCKSARVGGTLFFGICLILEKIARWPGPILWLDPTRKTAIRVSRQEIQPYIYDCAPVDALRMRTKEQWTVLEMMFKSCVLSILGAGSNSDLGGRQAELVILNEQDRIPNRKADAPPPSEEAMARSSQFEDSRKIVRNSTPTREGCITWAEFLAGSQHYCYVPCPSCGIRQRLTFWKEAADPKSWLLMDREPVECERHLFSSVKPDPLGRGFLVKGIPATGRIWWPEKLRNKRTKAFDVDAVAKEARYECPHCDAKIRPEMLAKMNDGYEWRSHNPNAPRDHISAQISALYSPFQSWGAIAKQFLLAIGNAMKLHSFYNLVLGLPFISVPTKLTKKSIELLQQASPRYERQNPQESDSVLILPVRPAVITMHVDVQQSEFWWTMRAWGADGSRYLLAWGSCVSFPELVDLSNRVWRYDHGPKVPDAARYEEFTTWIGIMDSGYKAKRPAGVYRFIHEQGGRWFCSKGGGYQGKEKPIHETQVLFNYDGVQVSIPLIHYNDYILQEHLYRFVIKERRPPGYHLPVEVDDNLVSQLTATHLVKRKLPDGRTVDEWHYETDPHLGDCEKEGEVIGHILSPDVLAAFIAKHDQARAALLASIASNRTQCPN